MGLLRFQIEVALLIFAVGLAAPLAPRCAVSLHPFAAGLGSMVAAGVLFAAALCHQLDAAQQSLAELSAAHGGFPWANFVCGCAFTLFLLLEEAVVHACFPPDLGAPAPMRAHSHGSIACDDEECCEADERTPSVGGGHSHGSFVSKYAAEGGSIGAAAALLVALCIHSALAGYAIGFASGERGAFVVAAAILAHKFFAGFALGVTLAKAEVAAARHLALAVIFALATPTGILIGVLAKAAARCVAV